MAGDYNVRPPAGQPSSACDGAKGPRGPGSAALRFRNGSVETEPSALGQDDGTVRHSSVA